MKYFLTYHLDIHMQSTLYGLQWQIDCHWRESCLLLLFANHRQGSVARHPVWELWIVYPKVRVSSQMNTFVSSSSSASNNVGGFAWSSSRKGFCVAACCPSSPSSEVIVDTQSVIDHWPRVFFDLFLYYFVAIQTSRFDTWSKRDSKRARIKRLNRPPASADHQPNRPPPPTTASSRLLRVMSPLTATQRTYANDLVSFIHASPTPFHAVSTAKSILLKAGFTELPERESWSDKIQRGKRYFVSRNGSSLIAFGVGGKWEPGKGTSIIGAHTGTYL